MLITHGDREVAAKFDVLSQRFEAAPGEPKRELLTALQGFDITPLNARLVARNLSSVMQSRARDRPPVFSYDALDTRFHLAETINRALALWKTR
jgi:hypothetical protein